MESNSVEKWVRLRIKNEERKWDRAQTTQEKIRRGAKARAFKEMLHYLLNIDKNPERSVATDEASSNTSDK